MVLFQIICATLLVSAVSLIGVVFFGLKINRQRITFYLISLASGTMLGGTFIHLIPEALSMNLSHPFLPVALGIFTFFILEKFLIWRHCHHHQRPEDHVRPVTASMVLMGDAIHNLIDGIIVASAFMVNTTTGISITLAIMMHEVPQEIGDFGVLLHGGYSLQKALFANALSASTAILGGILAYFFLDLSSNLQAIILPLAAGGFLYIALADLIPQLHEQTSPQQTMAQIILLGTGFGIMLFLHSFSH